MTVRIPYTSANSFGKIGARAINYIILAKQDLSRLKSAMDAATAGGVNPAALENGDFGAVAVAAIPAATIVSSSVANPSVITTSTAHGIPTGYTATIAGHSGSTPSINGSQVVTSTGTTTLTIPVNVTVGGTGGTITAITTGINGALYYTAFNNMKVNLATVTDAALSEVDQGG